MAIRSRLVFPSVPTAPWLTGVVLDYSLVEIVQAAIQKRKSAHLFSLLGRMQMDLNNSPDLPEILQCLAHNNDRAGYISLLHSYPNLCVKEKLNSEYMSEFFDTNAA